MEVSTVRVGSRAYDSQVSELRLLRHFEIDRRMGYGFGHSRMGGNVVHALSAKEDATCVLKARTIISSGA